MSDEPLIEVNGKEIQNPVLRVLLLIFGQMIAVIALMMVPIILMGAFVIVIVAKVLATLLVIPHFILRMVGRRGFFKETRDKISMDISGKAFRRM